MHVQIVTLADPIVTPGDIPGDHATNDAKIAGYIAGVTQSFAAPYGELGRSLGAQTLLATTPCFRKCLSLPCAPVMTVNSVKWLDTDGAENTLASDQYRLSAGRVYFTGDMPAIGDFPDAVQIQYMAGYAAGTVPENARQAIIIATTLLKSMNAENPFLPSEQVEGVGQTSYAFSEGVGEMVRASVDQLLKPLRVRSV